MRSFPKLLGGISVGIVLGGLLATGALAQKKEGEKTKSKDKKETSKKAEDKSGNTKEKPSDGSDGKVKESGRLEIPVSKDHDAKGLKIPYFDGEGKKQMIFTIGVASRLDDEHVGMEATEVETFDENGDHEMSIDLPKSTLNVNTSVISTKKHVEIKRADFSITGETMDFDMKTKKGTLGGGVRMLIYNLDDEVADSPEPKTPR